MDGSLLKEYIELDRRRLSPLEDDCTNKEKFKKFYFDINELRKYENDCICATNYYHGSDTKLWFKFHHLTIGWFMLIIIAGLVACIYGGSIARFLAITAFMPIVWFGCLDAQKRGGVIIIIISYIGCIYLMAFRRIALFGNSANWLWVLAIVGILTLFFARKREYKELIKPNRKIIDDFNVRFEKTEQLIDSMRDAYLSFGDVAAKEQKEFLKKHPEIKLELKPRKPWFDFERPYDKNKGYIDLPKGKDANALCNYISTSELEKRYDQIKKNYDTLKYEEISPQKARELVANKTVEPFFEFGLPEITDDMICEAYCHKWDIDVSRTYQVTEQEEYEQRLPGFNKRQQLEEWIALGDDADRYYTKDYDKRLMVDKYRRERDERRKELEELDRQAAANARTWTFTERAYNKLKGNQLVFIRVYLPEQDLYGFYTIDSIEAVDKTRFHALQKNGYRYNPLSMPNNDSQLWVLYHEFIRHNEKCEIPVFIEEK